jgi:hypothetical protein
MALVLVLVAGVAMTSIARRSIMGALEAQEDAAELKRRWAALSIHRTFLDRSEELFVQTYGGGDAGEDARDGRGVQPAEFRVNCRLADVDYELVFTDEQAKLNINHLLAESTHAEAQSTISKLLTKVSDAYDATSAVRLRTIEPGNESDNHRGRTLTLGGYAQVFESASPERLVGGRLHTGLTAAITLWGDGKVNVRRADKAVIREACERALGPDVARALVDILQEEPSAPLPELLTKLQKRVDCEPTEVKRYLTDESRCHGLWIIAREPQRAWHAFSVKVDGGEQGMLRRIDFRW